MEELITEKAKTTITEVSKSQLIRVIDIALIGPTLIYAGAVKSNLPKLLKYSLIVFGVATIYYNAKNYYLTQKNINDAKIK